jgi:hypothetical protein
MTLLTVMGMLGGIAVLLWITAALESHQLGQIGPPVIPEPVHTENAPARPEAVALAEAVQTAA